MNKELKKAIINFIFDNDKYMQLTNITIDNFRDYIYDKGGNYLIGGEDVYNFIKKSIELLTNKEK